MHEPLGGRTAAVADVVLSAAGAGSAAHLAIVVKEQGVLPDFAEALGMQITRLELRGLEEGAGIDFALRADTAGSRGGSAHVEAGKLVAKGVEVEEGIGG